MGKPSKIITRLRAERKKARLKEIIKLRKRGLTNGQIAIKLFVSKTLVDKEIGAEKEYFTFNGEFQVLALNENEAYQKLEKRLNKDYIKIISLT